MTTMSNSELIEHAVQVVNARRLSEYLVGDVGAALISASGKVYNGVCIDASSGTGFCAEHSAIAAMVTAGENRIAKIVAVWKDEDGSVSVLAPCGRCREFMRQIQDGALETEVVLGRDEVVTLADLLPHAGRFQKLEP
jgi:cytidine deaminase